MLGVLFVCSVRGYALGMSILKDGNSQILFIRELCKHKTEEEIQEAEENFRRYLLLVKRICERLEQEDAIKNEDLTNTNRTGIVVYPKLLEAHNE